MEPSKKRPVPPIYLDRSSVAEALSLSESTIEELVRQDRFPRPRKISDRRAGWLMREVMEWAESRPVSDLLPVENSARARRAA